MAEKKVEKPRIELLGSTKLYTIELCSPVKEKLNQIKICAPNIVIKPCSPIEKIKCVPSLPGICLPKVVCAPTPCGPWVEGPIDLGDLVELPLARIDEISAKVKELTARVDAISKKVGTR